MFCILGLSSLQIKRQFCLVNSSCNLHYKYLPSIKHWQEMGISGETCHVIYVHVSIFTTERNLLVSGNLLCATRTDGGKEKQKDLGVPNVSKSHRSKRQQKLNLWLSLRSPADAWRGCVKNTNSNKTRYTKDEKHAFEGKGVICLADVFEIDSWVL